MENLQKVDSFQFEVDRTTVDKLHRMRPSALCNMMLACAGRHADTRGFGATRKLGWVMARMVLDIKNIPLGGQKFTIETFIKNAGISVALAFITLGRSTSFGNEESTLSILSFTSMKLRSISDLWLNSIKMLPLPFTASHRMSCNAGIWISCILSGFITCSFISLADEPFTATCTVICGISTLGIREMGNLPMATIPTMSIATIVIETAIGLSTSLLSIKKDAVKFL